MNLRLTILREIAEKREKIAYWNKIAQRLRTTQDCNADYYAYKEIEAQIAKWKERLKRLRRCL